MIHLETAVKFSAFDVTSHMRLSCSLPENEGITLGLTSESCPLEGEHHPPTKILLLSAWRYQMDDEKMIKNQTSDIRF